MRTIYLIFLSSFLMFFNSCRKEQTSWNTDWRVPVINDTLTLNKYVNDSTLFINSSNDLEVNLKRTLLDVNITDILTIPDTTIHKDFVPQFISINVNPGFSFINDVQDNDLKVPNGAQLKIAKLKKGFIDVKLLNPIGTIVIFQIDFPGITKNGVQLTKTLSAPAGTIANPSQVSISVDLEGYQLDLRGNMGNSFNKVPSIVTVKSDPNGTAVTVTNQQITKLDATFRDVKFNYARGYFGNQIFEDIAQTKIDFLNKIESGLIDISNVNVKLKLTNGIKAPAKVKFNNVSNVSASGNTVSLTHPQLNNFIPVNSAYVSGNSLIATETVFEFNNLNSNMEAFIENLGSILNYAYRIELNPNGNDSGGWNEVYENSVVKLEIEITMPLNPAINQLTLVDTFDVNLENKSQNFNFLSGNLEMEVSNGFPIGTNFTIDFLDENLAIIESIVSQNISGNQFGSSTYNGISVFNTKLNIELNSNLLGRIKDIKKIRLRAVFNTNDPSTNLPAMYAISSNAFLGIKAFFNFELNTKV